jgi:hypothetical protein
MALKRWVGGATAVPQITTITFSTYAAAETYTLTINGKDVSFTSVAGTNSEIWAGLQLAWEGSSAAEHVEAIATVSSGVVLTSRTAGKPFTVSASATTGTATVTETQAATGPNHFDAAGNWEGGVAPVVTDSLLFADSDVDCLYNLDIGFAVAAITIEKTYSGRLGLARVSDSGYREYRGRYLVLSGAATITIGEGYSQGASSNRILIDCNDQVVTADVYSSGQGDGVERAIQLLDPNLSSVLAVYGGRVLFDGSGGAASLAVIAREDQSVAPDVEVSSGLNVGAVTAAGSNTELNIRGAAASLAASLGAAVVISGSATCPVVSTASGSRVFWDTDADLTTSLNVYQNGFASFARRKEARTVAAAAVHSGGTLTDPHATITWTTGVALVGLISDVTLDLGRNKTLQLI